MPSSLSGSPGPRKTVALLMLVVACGHFNRVGISVAGTERIIPAYGIDPVKMGLVYTAFLDVLHAGDAARRLVHRPLRTTSGPSGSGLRFRSLRRTDRLRRPGLSRDGTTSGSGCWSSGRCWEWSTRRCIPDQPGWFPTSFRPRRRPQANGVITFSACLGIAATQLVMGALIDRFDWQVALLISSGMTLVVALVWAIGTRSATAPSGSNASRPPATIELAALWSVLRQRSVIAITISYTAYGYFQYLFFYWITYYFETIQHQDRGVARGYTTGITLAMGAGMLCGGWLTSQVPATFSPWMRRGLVPLLGMFASGGVFELGLLASKPQVTLAAFVLAAAFLGACEAAFWTTAVELGGPYGGTAAGLMNTGGNAGGTLSPTLTPLLGGLAAQHLWRRRRLATQPCRCRNHRVRRGALWWIIHPPDKSEKSSAADDLAEPLL